MLRPVTLLVVVLLSVFASHGQADELPDTQPLTWEDDIASRMVEGIDVFLLKEIDAAEGKRARHWKRDYSSVDAYRTSVAPNRKRLAHILGLRDERVASPSLQILHAPVAPAEIAHGAGYTIHAVRWPALEGVDGEGLLLVPKGPPIATVVAIPDASQTPEQLVGLVDGVPDASQYARRLAESGCQVLVPVTVNRDLEDRGPPYSQRQVKLTSRELLYRPSFVLGRHIIGYELQKILAAVDCFAQGEAKLPLGVIGWGEGGMLALYAAALDDRISAACVSGYFGDRRDIWRQPIDRNVFGLLDQFADAEVASLIAPRRLIIEACGGPEVVLTGPVGAPGRLGTENLSAVKAEVARAEKLINPLADAKGIHLAVSDAGRGPFGTEEVLTALLSALAPENKLAKMAERPQWSSESRPDAAGRHARQVREIERHTQRVLEQSPYVRSRFMEKLDTSSLPAYEKSAAEYRQIFAQDVIGQFDSELLPLQPRTRKFTETAAWTGYEVVLDVYPEVIAYGLLLLPKDIAPGETRPVVVCQHGLEGRPQQTVTGDHSAYHDFAAKLADEGFIVFAPQNPYLFQDRFRTLQRKANPLGKTLFSIITAQHRQILNWLKTLPAVDDDRIAFYGLSYGGKTAMRVPALLPDYCLSICSADFNDWVWKNASTLAPHSYVWTGEYEIFEFDLGSTFNYAEMAALIASRPFMVERGHFDGVAPDERVALEFAKVRNLYQARLGIGERAEIEWFVGPHTINGKGTFEFLRRHLDWPKDR